MEWTTNMEGGGTLFFRDEGAYLYFEANRVDDGKGLYKVLIQGMSGVQVLGTMSPCETGLKLSRMVSRSTLGQWGCLPVTKAICQQSYVFEDGKQFNQPIQREKVEEQDIEFEEKIERKKEENIEKNIEENIEEKTELFLPFLEEQEAEGDIIWEPLPQEVGTEDFLGEIEAKEECENLSSDNDALWLPVEEEDVFLPCLHPEQGIFDFGLKEKFSRCTGVLREETVKGFSLAVPYSPHKEFTLTTLFCFGAFKRIRQKKYVVFGFSKEGKPCF